jgi:sulfite exporter TauE/SafE
MIVWAIDQARTGHGAQQLERWSPMSIRPVRRWLHTLRGRKNGLSTFLAGLILGFHPCGLLFALLLTAAATGSWWRGGITLVAFGLGTIPALVSVALAGFYGRQRLTGRWASYATALLIGLSGVLFALRGLAVNGLIPDVNPWLF